MNCPPSSLLFRGRNGTAGSRPYWPARKTALTGLLQILEHAAEPVPEPGQRFLGGSILPGQTPAVDRSSPRVRIVPISEVDDDYARAEGRGYADATDWRRAHEDFFRSEGIAGFLGVTPVIDDGTLVVTERFRLIN